MHSNSNSMLCYALPLFISCKFLQIWQSVCDISNPARNNGQHCHAVCDKFLFCSAFNIILDYMHFAPGNIVLLAIAVVCSIICFAWPCLARSQSGANIKCKLVSEAIAFWCGSLQISFQCLESVICRDSLYRGRADGYSGQTTMYIH